MAKLETVEQDARLNSWAQEAHLIRTRDRIAQMKALAESPHSARKLNPNQGEIDAERELILREVEKYEGQLQEALHQTNGPAPVAASPPGLTEGLVAMVKGLQAELASLKATLTPKDDAPKTA